MPVLDSKNFGTLPYDPAAVIVFPAGLPGFEERRDFLPVRLPESEPLVFLQSLEDPGLCFVTLPLLAVEPGYQLTVADEDARVAGFPSGVPVVPGGDVLCLTVVTLSEEGPTVNLLAPIVVNLRNQRAVQAIAPNSTYAYNHPLMATAEASTC
jgi:flagellar assembly factor FliW